MDVSESESESGLGSDQLNVIIISNPEDRSMDVSHYICNDIYIIFVMLVIILTI